MKGYQTSCFVCVCNLWDDGVEGEWELLGAISIKPWLRCATEELAITLPLLIRMRRKLFETWRCIISEWRFTFPDEL